MNFIFIQPHLEFGGAEKQTVLLANELTERGHTVTVLLHEKRGGLLNELDPSIVVQDCGISAHLAIPVVAMRLRKELRKLPPSTVIVKLWSSIMAVGLIWRGSPHKFVFTEDLDPVEHIKYISLGRLKQMIVRGVFRKAEYLVANTSIVAERMMRVYGLRKEPTVIYPSVNLAAISRNRTEKTRATKTERLRIISVGSLVPLKGHLVTYDALRKIDRSIDWTIVGDGPLMSDLEKIAASYSTIRLTGPQVNPFSEMSDSHLMVHSATSEAFGVVLLEAVALGIPVIAANAVGPAELSAIIQDPARLQLYEAGDSDALAATIAERLRKPLALDPPCEALISRFSVKTAAASWEGLVRAD